MPNNNPLRQFAEFALRMPKPVAFWLLTAMFRFKVKLVGTTKLKIISTDLNEVTFFTHNRKKVQNHIGQVHAATMALLAESATGFVVGLNLPKGKLPLIKSMQVNYLRRSQGAMKARAWLTAEQLMMMQTEAKGETVVSVEVTDESSQCPIECHMLWAWIEKK